MQDLTKRAVILSAVPVTPALSAYLQPGDTVVACDAGYRNAAVLGIQPDLIVGDFDSAPKPETTGDMIILPHVKDDTDTHYAAKWLCERGVPSYRHAGCPWRQADGTHVFQRIHRVVLGKQQR